MGNFRQTVVSSFPGRLRSALRSLRKNFQARFDFFYFPFWLFFQCARHRKKAVILFRLGALGDVVCTLPMCGEIRKQHPARLLVYVTLCDYVNMVRLSNAPDCVYGSFWKYGSWNLPVPFCFGLVEKIYIPQTTEERFPKTGSQSHLVDDLAASCGLTIPTSSRQPRLFPSSELVKKTLDAYGLAGSDADRRQIIGINCGRTWPVRMWDAAKWQALVDRIHTEHDAVILQFGLTPADGTDEFDRLAGVQSLVNRVKSDELVALVTACHLLVSIDSGPAHLAGAVGTPVVGLFGAVNPMHRLPPETPAVGLFADVPCRFCHHATPVGHWLTGCPNEILCMQELEVQTVFQAVKTMLAKTATHVARP